MLHYRWTAVTSIFQGKSVLHFSPIPIHISLCSLHADWDPWLKPNVRPKKFAFNMSFLQNSHNKAKEPTRQPKKQKQANPAHNSQPHPQPLTGKPRLPPSPKPKTVPVKTPRPAITAGLDHDDVVAAMMNHGAAKWESSDFLEYLQVQNILCSSPAQGYLPIRFPSMVVEAKSYTTSKPIFVAQNQASVSGSCTTNLQHKLADLTRIASQHEHIGDLPRVAFIRGCGVSG